MSRIGIALYGLGTVGSGLVDVIAARRAELEAHGGVELSLRHVVVRNPERPRAVSVDRTLFTTDWRAPLRDPGVDVVVEVMGGMEPARTVIHEALVAGKHVVTANKALIAAHGAELERIARARGALLRYEGAVCGAIPVLHAIRGALVGNRITRVCGIVNGTTNYILTRMAHDALSFADALAQAQALGFAEADPGDDLSGLDAAHKLVILVHQAMGRWVCVERVAREGIERVTASDIARARARGAVIKLVADAALEDGAAPRLRVGPTELPVDHPLAKVDGEQNAVLLESDFAGPLFFTGRGAGARPTGSAVYGDLIEAVVSRQSPVVRGADDARRLRVARASLSTDD
ncbi:MAG TPA: homoserine dehydrogenase [Gemmatimonadaceae bacterium]